MGQALYRKYRSRSFDALAGQEHIVQTLQNAVKHGRISHAYLFTGPRGVGKTSVARILAHLINDLPYTDDSAHVDIIEIDAASNRRIDEIRELREKVYVAPAIAKYKVYIIDEVHMLTREAFNALLKTLEEPPAHVVFILATTDAHKLPETIISRTQRFNFKPASLANLTDLLAKIAKQEKINVDDEALALMAQHSGGSFRDSLSLLDQASSRAAKIDKTAVEALLGLPPASAIESLAELAVNGATPSQLMSDLDNMFNQGYRAATIAQQLGRVLRERLIEEKINRLGALLELLNDLIEVPAAHDPDRALELALLRSLKLPEAPVVPVASPEPVEIEAAPEPAKANKPEPAPEKLKKANPATATDFDETVWSQVLQALKKKYNTLYGVVRMAQPDFSEPGRLRLAFAFGFHQKRLSENSNRQKLADTISELTGQVVKIDCVVDKSAQPPQLKAEAPAPTDQQSAAADGELSTISNIFGNAELLES